MKTKQLTYLVVLAFGFLLSPKIASATDFATLGSLKDWISTGATLFASHEQGHVQAARSAGTEMEYFRGISYRLDTRPQPVPPAENIQIYVNPGKAGKTGLKLDPDSYSTTIEQYSRDADAWTKNMKRQEAVTAGGGFMGQQTAVDQMTGDEKMRAMILSGVFKLGYVLYDSLTPRNGGDVRRTVDNAGVPAELPITALLVSGLSEIYRASTGETNKWRINYNADLRTGAVGVTVVGKF